MAITSKRLQNIIAFRKPKDFRRDRRRLSLRRAAMLAIISIIPSLLLAQDIGSVGMKTVTQAVFSSAACAGAPLAVNINNQGQIVHYLVYQTAGTINSISVEFQGRNDDTLTWQRISTTDNRTAAGAVFANVYLNFIRAVVTACSGTGTITATYSGTAVAATPIFGGLFIPGVDELTHCTNQAVVQFTASGAGSTRIITAAGGGRRIVLCHLSVGLNAPTNLIIERGTGINCGTGNVDLTGAYQNVSAIALDFGYWSVLQTTVNNDVCLNVSGAVTVGGVVIYAEF